MDAQLLAAIRNDLARSPFQGEGHRKVHARLRILDGVRVSRTRVLRVMRAQGLLSPHRGRQGEPKPHDGTIVTSAPDVMWGTDGARVLTVDDGWVWTFAAVDHWNAECVGWHVCKVRPFRGPRAGRARAPAPLRLGRGGRGPRPVARMDHGSQYLSDHFLNQVRYWGIRPSFGLLKEPRDNGVVERWNRRSRSRPSTAGSFKISPTCAPPSPKTLNRCWRLEKRPIARHSRPAKSTSYAKPRSPNCVQETGCGKLLLFPGQRTQHGLQLGERARWIDCQ